MILGSRESFGNSITLIRTSKWQCKSVISLAYHLQLSRTQWQSSKQSYGPRRRHLTQKSVLFQARNKQREFQDSWHGLMGNSFEFTHSSIATGALQGYLLTYC